MAWPTIFANLAAGNQPLALFDAMFAQVAQMVAIPCTAAGTNSITLTPIGNAPTLTGYQNFSTFRAIAANSNTNLTSAQFQALPNLPVYHSDGVTQIGNTGGGEIIAGQEYVFVFVQSLNGGVGGFFLENATVPAIAPVAGSAFTNLVNSNTGGSYQTQINSSYDELVMNNVSGGAIRALSQSFTVNAAVAGVVNGIDVGALAASNWYALWGISNGATSGGLLSLSFTNPAMPAGYTFKKRIGAFLTDASSHLFQIMQRGNRAQWVIGTSPANNGVAPMQLTNGTVGTYSSTAPTLSSISLAGVVPPSATSVTIVGTNNWKGNAGAGTNILVAPNVNWGGANNGPNGTNGAVWPLWMTTANGFPSSAQAKLILEALTMAVASNGGGMATNAFGWEDNLG